MQDMNEYSSIEGFAEGSEINREQESILKILHFPWRQNQMKKDFALSHIPMKSQERNC
uniref:Uncharacterized protein n=1 Tax=Lynx canadensis TaxID=61383 RepID=A0A667H7Q3_LYNCA